MALCEVALSDGSDLLAEEINFGLGWNSPSHTTTGPLPGTNQPCLTSLNRPNPYFNYLLCELFLAKELHNF